MEKTILCIRKQKKDAHPTRLQTSDDAQAVQRDAHLSGTKVEINSENREEIEAARAAAVERRKAESVQQDGDSEEGSGGSEEAYTEVPSNDRRGGDGSVARRQPGDLAQTENLNYKLSDEVDENGHQFVLNSDGNIEFGRIGEETNLTPAPIKLSLGNSKYGRVHLEKRHREQIRNAGFNSIEEFVEYVATNYTRIGIGKTV